MGGIDTDSKGLGARTAAAPVPAGPVPRVAGPESPGPDTDPQESLKSRAIRASGWAVAESAALAALRLVTSLVLTRLVARDAFGVMVLVTAFIQGLEMFSNIGVRGSILYHKRGLDPVFLNTAWTVQVVRGFLLWATACVLALPMAAIYGVPLLAWVLPVAGLKSAIGGFNSTSMHTLNRKLTLGKMTIRAIWSHVTSLVVMVVWAYFAPSVWVLVGGTLIGAAMGMVLSHTLLDGAPSRFTWEPEARRELMRFGRWILISTILSFLASRGDRFIMGGLLTLDELALYGVATIISASMAKFITQYSGRVLHSLYARLAERGEKKLRRNMRRIRVTIMLLTLPPLCVMAVGGQRIVELLWPEGFEGAGWMLTILAAGGIGGVVNATMLPMLLAVGDSKRHLIYTCAQFASVTAGILIGGWVDGVTGVITGIALSSAACYPVLVACVRKYGVWLPGLDLAAAAGCLMIIGIGLWLF